MHKLEHATARSSRKKYKISVFSVVSNFLLFRERLVQAEMVDFKVIFSYGTFQSQFVVIHNFNHNISVRCGNRK